MYYCVACPTSQDIIPGAAVWATAGFEVTHEKPPAEFYIDDHGFRFTSWGEVERKLLQALRSWRISGAD